MIKRTLSLLDKTRVLWKWFRNKDDQMEFKDEVILCNSIFGLTNC